jgi:hypothetical protein
MDLSNFYKNYSFKYNDFMALFQVYTDIIASINTYAEQVKNNTAIPEIETYRIFPFQRLPITDATYNIAEVLENIRVIKKYNLDSMTLVERMDAWNNDTFTLDQKVDMLDINNSFVLLTAKRGFVNEKDYAVIDFNLFSTEGEELFRNVDYALKANKLYLFGDIATVSPEKYAVLTDIAIDFNTPEDLMGKSLDLSYSNAISKNEYNEILKMLMGASLGGPTVANLKSAVQAISGADQGDLYDKYVRDPKKRKRWEKTYYTDFDFVVTFPETYAANMEKLNIIIDYLKLVKPAYTKFFVILQSLYSDLYNILVYANDSYNMDYILEHTEDDAGLTVLDDYNFDFATETTDEIYSVTPPTVAAYRLNSITGRLNINLYTFGTNHSDETDWHVIDIIRENLSDIYMSASITESELTLISQSDEEIYAGVADEVEVAILTEITNDNYWSTIQELVADSLNQVFSDEYLSSGIVDDSEVTAKSTIIESPIEESYNGGDDSYSASITIDTSPHYRLNSSQQLNINIRTDRIVDEIAYNY